MAQVLKRCTCPRSAWAKCPHSWTVRWWDGKQREQSFKRNHKQAVAFARQAEAGKLSIHRGDPPSPVSLQSYARTWLDSLTGPRNTIRTYDSALRNHVLPQHGRRPLTEVAADREGIQELLRSLSPGTARVTLTALRALMTEAASAGRIETDRLQKLQTADLSPLVEFTFPSYGQLRQLADTMDELGPAIWIMRGCGLRPSEVLAVCGKPDRPGGPGFYDNRLRIMQQRPSPSAPEPLKKRKPHEFRDVPVPGYVSEQVKDLGAGYLFSIEGSYFRRRFRAAADAAGLPGFRAHDLRHVFASVALSNGVPVTDVSRWLGHRNIQTTYSTYSHFIPTSWDTARDVLDREFKNWSAGPPPPPSNDHPHT